MGAGSASSGRVGEGFWKLMPPLQKNRYELKYTVTERVALEVRKFILGYLSPDEYNDPDLPGYLIHSLYLDTADLQLCNATLLGLKNRFKLRIRFYDENPESPCFCEIKRRVQDTILKQRAIVSKQAASKILAGHWPVPSDMRKFNDADWGALQQFCRLKNELRADGTAFVSYLREAYISPNDSSVRVTFDRKMTAGAYNHLNLTIEEPRLPTQIKLPNGEDGVVLELKFVNRFPNWMRELVQVFHLQRCAMPKYVRCVTALQRLNHRQVVGMIGKAYE